ncbi:MULTISPECIES: diaminopimelate epimerase [Undibacterium]|jgi:diaminopimelate epimerase|uniref:Diaminopimelate epimerase n=1 Tax=Undibacterium umbellatum TaxID=2762300 RepID=A0ABR6ZDR5_9BURK|nr:MULTISPECIES: diaminopimelate epimerase [Undibacterium]MBC3909496.1 diaminopimelate epimerase [Undibacterium umbellatum]MDP1980064.1 diaminopimelate epimerase [Undibacterium sp.]
MKLKFTKMHGAGNDFVVIDAINQHINFTPAQWRLIADRRFGIGADQILVVERPESQDVDFRYRIYNADGGEVEQCGNGSRAFVQFVLEKGLTSKSSIRVETMSGIIEPRMGEDGNITVNMGAPILEAAQVPFNAEGLESRPEGNDSLWPLDINGKQAWISAVSMGNPHAVQIVAAVNDFPVAVDGPLIEHHPRFPRRVNAGFMEIVARQQIRLRVFERGAGETLACGTGACAAAVAGIRRGLLDSPVRVSMRGGELSIAWAGEGQPVFLSGPAVTVFEGEINLTETQ